MLFDLVIRNALTEPNGERVDIAVKDGVIAAIEPAFRCEAVTETDAKGAFAFSGFAESHIHLDKAGILGRCTICEGTLAEAVRETARAKKGFEIEDVYARASAVVEKAIASGTTWLRTFVEIDPRAGFRSFEAILRVKADYAFAIDIEICAFAQEGLTQEPETFAMLDRALSQGADLVGGCPYTDPDPRRHAELIFELALKHDVAVDFHLDFDLNPENTNLPAVIEETMRHGWGGRVSVGHVTNLSALPAEAVRAIAMLLAEAGIALTVLPATDLFLNGRAYEALVPRGVAPAHLLAECGVVTSIATNNVLNPFTPYGDASLVRMANLYANVAQLSRDDDMALVFSMVSASAAKLMGKAHGLAVGGEATVVLLDCAGPADAVREVARVIGGWKNGRQSFWNGLPQIFRPAGRA
ncbi:amidohydrolase (plasmid) [Rhizobium sp. ACO-34A]|nr:amidohydrolase family protein [Rhizobium sp. ACO-34A]ATN37096.1 amidohydrolase [Rhizobium sp. ACO-34A]